MASKMRGSSRAVRIGAETGPMPQELPLAGVRPERADARRNRERILTAARELVREQGIAATTMEQVAARAGVAKGTVFQRFRNRAGLAVALTDADERDLQEAVLGGAPPLGPGASPEERLVAFLLALLELTRTNLELLLISDYDRPGGRFVTGAYAAWRLHVTTLLRELGTGDDAEGLAHALLAPLGADLVAHRLREEGTPVAVLRGELERLARATAASYSA